MGIVHTKPFLVLFSVIIILVKLWLVKAHPLMATITPHDDLLFISQAHNILSGAWLGDYNQLTLIKGQFYPIFITLCYYLNIPLLTAQQLLYAGACLISMVAIHPFVRQKWLLTLFFVFLLLNPFSYNYPAIGRVFRLGIYAPLGLLTVSCIIGLYIRSRQSWKGALVWSVAAGICLAAFWNTREESIWILPSLMILLIPLLLDMRGIGTSQILWRISLFVIPFLILLTANYSLKSLNLKHYGIFATIELETPEFKAAYGGLLRVKSDKWRQFFPVVKDVRNKVYQVSPAFLEIKPFLDGSVGQKWQDLCECTDIPAAFFIWAFRDSVAAAGYHKDGPRTLQYYQRIGDEIDQACSEGKLDCRPRLTSLIPPWHREYNKLLLPTFYSVVRKIVSFSDFSASTEGMKSKGDRDIMLRFDVVTGEKLLTSRADIQSAYPEYHTHLNKEKTRILNDIGFFYRKMIPPLFIFSLAIFIFISARSIVKKKFDIFTFISAAALAGVMSIGFILTLLSITSYTEIGRAMHSAYPMVLLFIIAVLLDATTRLFPCHETKESYSTPEL